MENKKYFMVGNYPSLKQKTELGLKAGEQVFGKWKITTIKNGLLADTDALHAKQIHGGNIVKSEDLLKGRLEADGVTLERGFSGRVGITTADCAPVVIMTDRIAIALHISRKSIARGLMENVLTIISPNEINWVYVGPHICDCHFSFNEEDYMVRWFRNRFPEAVHLLKGVIYLSLDEALRKYWYQWKLHSDKIRYDGRCTYEIIDLPSYRQWRETGSEGKLGGTLTLVEAISS